MADQPPEAVTVVDRPDGTQIIYATAVLQATVVTGNQEEAAE